MEVPSTDEGTIEKINVKIGDKVSKGDSILLISSQNGGPKTQIPPVTEKIIEEAEKTLKDKKQKENEEVINSKNVVEVKVNKKKVKTSYRVQTEDIVEVFGIQDLKTQSKTQKNKYMPSEKEKTKYGSFIIAVSYTHLTLPTTERV